MNPVELVKRGTDEVVAVACGECLRVQSDYRELGSQRAAAEHCCRCLTCSCPLPRKRGQGLPELWCPECTQKNAAQTAVMMAEYGTRDNLRAAKNEEVLTKCLDRESARRLVQEMSDWSEDTYCAGWESGLEHELWERIHGDDAEGGDLARIRRLHKKCGGWWYWDDALSGKAFVLTADWERMRAERETKS